ncbi:oligosaccharide 4-alpha-D-glucosyltransferase [Salinimicrobium sediminis]|uniref:Oligosaccharide 4-alpha-D-glucosyltransferase n=1 Tax=Salinimicrobium sediminis TaxID=1343891 RepID=A0A285X6K7_9FLAO|nr:TIM-barrel domain-containing protein [Salinimicrobium sediminis]SOC80424.1 oligosaccharide 4-alpha-D-glucosyltransferase [Salinimicrobium sediminis]
MKVLLKEVPKMAFLNVLFLLSFSLAAQNPNRNFESLEKTEAGVEITTNDGKFLFRYYTPEIIEASFIPEGESFDENSHAVVLEPLEVNLTVSETENTITIDSEGLDIEVSKMPFQVTYYFEGEKVISEKSGYSTGGEHEKLNFNLTETEVLMGGGARALGMNRRGNRLQLYNRAHYGYESKSELLNFTLPVVLSSEKYMLHFDNAPIGYLDLDSDHSNTLTYETISGRKTYQLIVGKTWENIMSNYTLLTGRQPLPPRWALGNFSSRFGYHSREEVQNTIQKFREEKIPVDAVIIDLFWFGHEIMGTMGNLEFVTDSFPQPEEMIGDLAEDGVKTILVTEPFILTTSNRWEEAVENDVLAKDSLGNPFTYDFYFGNTGLIDVFDPEARDWFWNIYEELTEMGVGGWWGDLGEPEVHPEGLLHATGTANEVHNIYGHYWAKMIYEGYREDFPRQRPFILMRAGAAGSQRFGMIPWSGDVNRSWGGLKPQPEISLQMGLQGLAYMHSDLGGFAGDNLNDELYVRWLQYGVFQPIYRPHAQEAVPSEPVFREPKTKALSKKAIELRYQLLPYNYTLAFRNSTEGLPLMRPLFFEEPDNFRLYSMAGTYLWGKDFLISPVLQENVSSQEVYFPKESNWIDFYSGEKYEGGSTAVIGLEEEYIPTFVRGGAIIPMAKPLQTTQNFSAEDVEVHYFFDPVTEKSSGILFHDDGKTPETYQTGDYELLNFESEVGKNEVTFSIKRSVGNNRKSSEFKKLNVVVHHMNTAPKRVNMGTEKIPFRYDKERRQLIIPVELKTDLTKIKITN